MLHQKTENIWENFHLKMKYKLKNMPLYYYLNTYLCGHSYNYMQLLTIYRLMRYTMQMLINNLVFVLEIFSELGFPKLIT